MGIRIQWESGLMLPAAKSTQLRFALLTLVGLPPHVLIGARMLRAIVFSA